MPANNNSNTSSAKSQEYQELVRKIADRVWEMWRQDLRQGKERRGSERKQ
jgi:hypothetical protein